MIESIIYWSIKQRFLVLAAAVVLAITGYLSILNTPVDAIPDLSDVQVIIKTSYPGQAPQVVEDQVTYPLTTAMLAVPKAITVRGYSFFGDSYVYVIFADGTDLYWARSRVLEYLNQVSSALPPAAKPQLGPDATGVGWIYSYALIDRSGQHDLSGLRSIQDWFLRYELQTVPGVAEVATVGGMVKQYQVIVDPNKLRAYNIPLSHISMAIERANQESGASVIEMAEAEYMVRASGYLQSIEDIKKIPLGLNQTGTPLQLGDIAKITVGPQMRRGIAELNGDGEVVGGIVVMRYGENAQSVINEVKLKLESLKASLPDGVEIIPTYDRSALIERAVDNLYQKLLEEFAVVALVCAIFLLHLRSSLVIIISLPLGILAAFIIMRLQGINANIMSLGGIAIAIGAMVDAAIVMTENLHKHIEQTPINNENRWQIVARAASEVGPSLFFSLLIITVSFFPVFALEAQEGKLFSPLAFTKTYAMAAAAILAITIVPVLMGYLVNNNIKPERKNPISRFLIKLYQPILSWALDRPKTVIIAAVVLIILGLLPLRNMGSEFMPPLDEGDLMYMPTTYAGISIGKARQLLQQTNKLIMTLPEVKTTFGKIGRAETATDPAPLTMIETVIQFKPQDEWRPGINIDDIKQELDQLIQFPGLTNAWVMPIKTRIDMLATGIKTPVGIKIAGDDLVTIEKIGTQLEQLLPHVRGTASVYSERVTGGRYIKVDINRDKAARFGLNIADVQSVIRTAIGGTNVTDTVEGLERYPVNLRYPQSYRNTPEQLKLLPVITANNKRIALGDIADIYVEEGPPAIKSENARLNGWTYIDIEGRDLGTYVEEAKQYVAANLTLPAGYSIHWTGQYEYMLRAQEKLKTVVPLTLLIILALLYINFRDLRQILIIIGTLPFALAGGIWFTYLLGYQLSVAVTIGFIALAGVAAELGVLILVYINQAYQHRFKQTAQNQSKLTVAEFKEVIIEGCSLRVRPIMMTSASIIVGMTPIMLGSGTGSDIMQRIAAPLIGGMLSALLLALLIIPVIYFITQKHG